MRTILNIFFVFAPFLVISCNQERAQTGAMQEMPLFQKVEPSHSNITFSNNVAVDLANGESLFDYDYFYNGAGVGLADLNNDGLQDIFFCGNQTPNKLYINKGGLKFEDVSKTAKINTRKDWANGVTFADVNGDDWLDIYVSQGGPLGRNRKNLLYINQKNSTFIESAAIYGLDDPGISTQSVFFDFDKDGDLDCFVMNENPLYGVQPQNFYKLIKEDPTLVAHTTSRLYQNNEGKYKDITKKAGLFNPSFGLGIMVSDINNDGWMDIYISNDYYIPDALYINRQNGTFTDEIKTYTNHTSYYGMGIDMADINNDGHEDIFALDMASQDHIRSKTLMPSMNTKLFDLVVNKLNFQHQYMFNALQLNSGFETFNNVAHSTGMAKTDWSWAGLLADFDNDGDRDAYISNGYRKYGTDNDFLKLVKEAEKQYEEEFPLELKRQLYDSMPSEKLINYAFENEGSLNFIDVSAKWGFNEASFSNGTAYGDLDNDGDLELVVNNIDGIAFLFKNMSSEKGLGNFIRLKFNGESSEPFPHATIKYDGKMQAAENKRVRGYISSSENVLHFGLGEATKVDTIQIRWPSGAVEEKYNVSANKIIEFSEENATRHFKKTSTPKSLFSNVSPTRIGLDYKHTENPYNDFSKEILLPYKQSTLGPFMAKGDLNGDGEDDLFFGGAQGQPAEIYLQVTTGFKKINSKVLGLDRAFEDMEAAIYDFDNDGDNDIYVVSGGNEHLEDSQFFADRIYLNDGNGNFSRHKVPILDNLRYSGKSVAVLDFNQDGFKDLVIANRIIPQSYPKAAPSFILRNTNGKFKDVTSEVAPELANFGIINKVINTDFDNDGWQDFIVVGEWTGIGLFKNFNGKFKNIATGDELMDLKGWWFTIGETDINRDGLKDYLIGNLGLNSKYTASKEYPLKVFGNDFDNNGNWDIVLSYEYKGKDVPLRGKECSSQQMPFIASKFGTYREFARASLEDIFDSNLDSSYSLEATEFRSILLVNQGKGRFKIEYLPKYAQLFPVLSCVFQDLNGDGYEDVILAGNIYNTEVETPRLDAGSGLVLVSNGENNYYPRNDRAALECLRGNVKSMGSIKHKLLDQEYILSLKNNENLSILKIEK